jgi:uncharacterized membrane protein YjfL (UPF0719 family)
MNEIFDRLVVRILLTCFVILFLFLYKYAHLVLYPSVKKQTIKKFSPTENPADTLHLFSRLLGIAIIFSSLEFEESSGIALSIFHFLVWGGIGVFIYLLSLYTIESVALYNFEYTTEILKRKNIAYAIVCFTHAIGLALMTKTIITQSENSFIILLVLWLLHMVLFGFAHKYYAFITKHKFNSIILNESVPLSLSYLGYLFGASILLSECFNQDHFDLSIYVTQVVLKVILALLIYPLFKRGIKKLFKFKGDEIDIHDIPKQNQGIIGMGIFEAILYLSAAILTSLIVNHINFGTIYPFF